MYCLILQRESREGSVQHSLINKCSQLSLFIAPPARGQYAAMWAVILKEKKFRVGKGSKGGGSGWMREMRLNKYKTGKGLNTLSIMRSSLSAALTSPKHYLPNDSQHIQMSQSIVCCVMSCSLDCIHTAVVRGEETELKDSVISCVCQALPSPSQVLYCARGSQPIHLLT